MASAEHEPIMGFWGICPQWVQGLSPWLGGEEVNVFFIINGWSFVMKIQRISSFSTNS